MKYLLATLALATSFALLSSNNAVAQTPNHAGHVVIPASSIEHASDIGKRAHTNIRLFIPEGGFTNANPQGGPPYAGYGYETPASLACLYNLVTPVAGCNPNTVTANPVGGAKAIAIVDAFDDPTAVRDLDAFSKQFGIVSKNPFFQVVFASGNRPPQDSTGGWELEESLDIEWAHAMAPNAKLYLVEAPSNNTADLYKAVEVASQLVSAAGGGEVSMSWGGGEFQGETSVDTLFSTPGVVYFASAGDGEGVIYPSTSPNVVSAGGTTNSRNPFTFAFQKQTGWNSAGGGPSAYEPLPSYQSAIASITDGHRGIPDVSFDADPNTGVWILDSTPYEGQGGAGAWWIVGGTSVSSPALAGIVNLAGHFNASSQAELTEIYSNLGSSDFQDVTEGTCYYYDGFSATTGWDFCTGVGTVSGTSGK